MNQLAFDRRHDNHSSPCADVTMMAERELASFLAAVTELFGSKQAQLSAADWLQELEASDGLPASTHEWRCITMKIAARLAGRLNPSSMSRHIAISLAQHHAIH